MRPGELKREVHVHSLPNRAKRPRLGRALAAGLLLGAGFVGCASGPEWTVVHDAESPRSAGAIAAGQASVEAIGRAVLETIGYERLIELAMQAGFVTEKPIEEIARTHKGLLAMDGVAAGRVFVRVFTQKAVRAGITSQLDGPEPGPADVVAVGMLAIALVQAGFAVYEEIEKVRPRPVTTSAPPAPTATTAPPPLPPLPAASGSAAPTAKAPTPTPTTLGPTIPLPPQPPDCPRNESFAPDHTDNATGCVDKKGNLRCYSGRHRPCAGVHTHGIWRYQEIRNSICTPIQTGAVRCEGPFDISGPCGSVSTTDCREGGPKISGIYKD